ncbi:hypothetical protein [Pannonibacter phragmitetus]|uniref:hypothetical protein n=1 Tax=Pannonibacter phragmitetus TaxID=121719 RepID=UPI0013CE4726|nr:hypothetical protein [Pannonibacter phragmitetus]
MVDFSRSEQAPHAAPSRPFDVHRWSDYPELQSCLTDLMTELEALETPRHRARGEGQRKKFREALRCLVLDLYVAWKTDPDLLVGISLGNREYTLGGRYSALFLRWTSFKSAYELLIEAGYIAKITSGHFERSARKGKTTRIKATDKLIKLLTDEARLTIPRVSSRISDREVIILRGEKQKGASGKTPPSVDYEDTSETRTMRENLRRINTSFQQHWFDLRIRDEELLQLQRRMQRDYLSGSREGSLIDFTQRTLVRIFSNGDWQQGGRFYRGWWQSIPKDYRKYITIDDKRTHEVDYSNLHPVLLYAEVGERLEGDAYSIESVNVPRNLIKKTFNKMVNAKGRIVQPADFCEDRFGMSWKELQNAIISRHKPIRDLFHTGYGLRLQRKDSEIAEAVILRFLRMNYPCLPVHDSFLVHHALRDELKTIMVEVFTAMTGQTIDVNFLDSIEPEYDPNRRPVVISAASSESLFKGVGPYAGYNQRIIDWRSGISRAGRL